MGNAKIKNISKIKEKNFIEILDIYANEDFRNIKYLDYNRQTNYGENLELRLFSIDLELSNPISGKKIDFSNLCNDIEYNYENIGFINYDNYISINDKDSILYNDKKIIIKSNNKEYKYIFENELKEYIKKNENKNDNAPVSFILGDYEGLLFSDIYYNKKKGKSPLYYDIKSEYSATILLKKR